VASVRHQVRIERPAATVWELAGDPRRLHEWFPGITACSVDGDVRTITLGTGMQVPERIATCDNVLRRFQYRITAPLFQEHQGTIDVIDLGDGTSLVVYSTDAEPRTMALVTGGATAGALHELKRLIEHEEDQ
jgi:uncharacterized protein YndB with AHSA1/START domain